MRRMLVAGLVLAILFSAFAQPASAWKPYDHNFTANAARADALDGMVSVLGRDYTVSPRVVQALAEEPAVYNAGVVGPDAFPDFFMGQGVIHPVSNDPADPYTSGEWLEWLYDQAWQAQDSASYSEKEKLQILAFTYGFLTHAAGDMWAHTLVNDFAGGIFPDFLGGDANVEGVTIAVKHIILEQYMADATPGYDGNRHDEEGRGPAPGGDISDDSTPGIPMEAPPDKFVYDVFIARQADAQGHVTQPMPGQPTADRGFIVDRFYDWRNFLSDHAGPSGDVQAAIDNFRNLQGNIDAVNSACLPIPNPIDCA